MIVADQAGAPDRVGNFRIFGLSWVLSRPPRVGEAKGKT
jgi:hypothetical protein